MWVMEIVVAINGSCYLAAREDVGAGGSIGGYCF